MKAIQTLAFVVNVTKPGARELGVDLEAAARRRGIETRLILDYPLPAQFLAGVDACCAIGGDGTILELVTEATERSVPVLGVNLGKLGFLATLSAEEAQGQLFALLQGSYRVYPRSLLECGTCSGKVVLALNDIVIRSVSTRVARLEVRSNDQKVNQYLCDGLIFSTPTGSTAYNLSAGGPLIHPSAQVIAMTPICPHTLSNRSVIFEQSTRLTVVPQAGGEELNVSVDGHRSLGNSEEFPLEIAVSRKTFPLLHQDGYSHFSMVRQKLGWGTEG